MPTFFFYGPSLELEKKRTMIKEITAAASKATGIPEKSFTIYLRETQHENVSVGGKLLSERD
ncbi:MAG TPA: 4-oxalocrotonate tautomerase DmpI [Oscillospiraceae bacterium]|nr:4-oxalocrotonate tautomerase DmpI [Oscillospiraceae bacterium]